MKAADYLIGDEKGGVINNNPTEKQMEIIKVIEQYHPYKHKFIGATSKDAYEFIRMYYAKAYELKTFGTMFTIKGNGKYLKRRKVVSD